MTPEELKSAKRLAYKQCYKFPSGMSASIDGGDLTLLAKAVLHLSERFEEAANKYLDLVVRYSDLVDKNLLSKYGKKK